ncbi:MAG: hypothetical protein J7M38_11075 [Armatimonadetes bacterium]|nr:hypothetical protein [Armatimonadota bacterium]
MCQSYSRFPPHNGGVNVGFMDGHAKWLSAQEFAKPNSILFWY